ncbi:hypothetical protein OTU49_016296 [Cherax quadricarinatus]|uniref:Uncharacterized protein n=1 Tax=Cherax quadricarinatus TaxID=27406 RepID=A0AAW0Y8J8_CHEQU
MVLARWSWTPDVAEGGLCPPAPPAAPPLLLPPPPPPPPPCTREAGGRADCMRLLMVAAGSSVAASKQQPAKTLQAGRAAGSLTATDQRGLTELLVPRQPFICGHN